MRGVVDSWSESAGGGVIVAEDAQHYHFARADVIEGERALPGTQVSFLSRTEGDRAFAYSVQVLRAVDLAGVAAPVVVTDIRLPFRSVFWLVLQVGFASLLLSLLGALVLALLRWF